MHLATSLLAFALAFPPAEERYEEVPIEGDLNAILKQLLFRAEEEQGIQRLLEQIRNHPQMKGEPPWLKGLDANNPLVRNLLRDFAEKVGEGDKLTPQKIQEFKKTLEVNERMLRDWQQRLQQGENVEPPPFQGMAPPEPAPPPEQPLGEERIARWTRDALQQLDETEVGDFLRDSPAWQRALERLEQTIQMPQGGFGWLDRVPDNLRLPDGFLPEGLGRRFENWSLAGRLPELSLPRWRFSPPNLGNFGFGGGLRLGGAPSPSGSFNENLLWALVPVLLALLAFFFYRQLGRLPGAADDQRRLGPWPVDPSRVSTRLELIQAFEYLARLLVGDQVRTWNHQAVARQLGTVREPQVAHALARLYELARYTPGAQTLSAAEQQDARRHLLTLRGAGVPA